jgi:tetratricopeptide (TPR) repeat protein
LREGYDYLEPQRANHIQWLLRLGPLLVHDRPASGARTRTENAEGRDKGLAFPLEVAAALACRMLATTENPDERAYANNLLGMALSTLGGRESGTARLEEAVAAYRAALEEHTRDRVPLNWAGTQNNLGTALQTLGERESGLPGWRKPSPPTAPRWPCALDPRAAAR